MVLLKILNKFFINLISVYQYLVSPFFGQCCRYYPSCSSYAKKAFHTQLFHRALMLSIKRVITCQPFFGGGVDDLESGASHG